MRDYFKKKTWIITALMFLLAVVLSLVIIYFDFAFSRNIKPTQASAANNVSGYAWSSNIGWISFNCTNDSPACVNSNYGVNVDQVTGNFTGYAWSSNIGWISFNRRTCVGGADNGVYCSANSNCTSNNCSLTGPGAAGVPLSAPYDLPASLAYIANYNFSTHQVTGWAKILALGDDGWIKFNGTWPNGVTISSAAPPTVANMTAPNWNYVQASADALRAYLQFSFVNSAASNFSGWAWSPGDAPSIGWISFNCSDVPKTCKGGTNAGAACPNDNECLGGGCVDTCGQLSNYKVAAGGINNGSIGSAYRIKVTKADNTPVLDTGKCTGYNTPPANPIKCKFDINPCLTNGSSCQYSLTQTDGLEYNTAYQWWVQVWDNYGAASALTQYNTVPDTDNDDGVVLTFTTYKHKFPLVSASWFPLQPSRGEKVKFTDASQTFTTAAPTAAIACDAGKCAWLWTVPSGAIINDAATSTPTVTFNAVGANSVKLRVTDKIDGYYSEKTFTVTVNSKLPKWKEVKPE